MSDGEEYTDHTLYLRYHNYGSFDLVLTQTGLDSLRGCFDPGDKDPKFKWRVRTAKRDRTTGTVTVFIKLAVLDSTKQAKFLEINNLNKDTLEAPADRTKGKDIILILDQLYANGIVGANGATLVEEGLTEGEKRVGKIKHGDIVRSKYYI